MSTHTEVNKLLKSPVFWPAIYFNWLICSTCWSSIYRRTLLLAFGARQSYDLCFFFTVIFIPYCLVTLFSLFINCHSPLCEIASSALSFAISLLSCWLWSISWWIMWWRKSIVWVVTTCKFEQIDLHFPAISTV